MLIGVVGLGVVGKACKAGFEKLGYTVKPHDINLNTSINDLLVTEICYICVPTPALSSGECDVSIVTSVVENLVNLKYSGVIAIKSTVTPGTTELLIERFGDRIVFVPEFLKERSAEYDFIFNHNLLLIGTNNVNHSYLVQRSHGNLPKDVMRVSPTEAEMMKYYHNTFNATRIVFANIIYELCNRLNADYDKVKEAFLRNNNMPDEYLDVKPELRGYGGACLPKDVRAAQYMCDSNQLQYNFFKILDEENNKFKKTVFSGMRE